MTEQTLSLQDRANLIEKWRQGTATRLEENQLWESLDRTMFNRAMRHYKNTPDWVDDEEQRANRLVFLMQFIKENKDLPARLCIYKWAKLFPSLELLLELYGMEVLKGRVEDKPLTNSANRNCMYFKRQLADLQRKYLIWDENELTQTWINETTPKDRKQKLDHISEYRYERIREYAEEIINSRFQKFTSNYSDLSQHDQLLLDW
jgi:hypothetical protein